VNSYLIKYQILTSVPPAVVVNFINCNKKVDI